ncbi:MAG: hypothetical protein R2704_16075 [Microthrixaceae bacterium]
MAGWVVEEPASTMVAAYTPQRTYTIALGLTLLAVTASLVTALAGSRRAGPAVADCAEADPTTKRPRSRRRDRRPQDRGRRPGGFPHRRVGRLIGALATIVAAAGAGVGRGLRRCGRPAHRGGHPVRGPLRRAFASARFVRERPLAGDIGCLTGVLLLAWLIARPCFRRCRRTTGRASPAARSPTRPDR